MNQKPISYEELFEIVLDFYDAFSEVMKRGTDEQKAYTLRHYNDVRRLLAQRLNETEDIDFEKLEKAIERDTSEHGEKMRAMKEEIVKVSENLDPLIKKIESKLGPKKSAKIRKSHMERKLKSRL